MAKSPSFFGLRRGSTKSLTFQVLNGRQVTKDRVYDVKNPRTYSQMQQRMVMATAAAAYAGMREIVDHSFEGVTYGQPTMSKFISENAKMLLKGLLSGNSDIAFNPYQDRTLYPNPYIISKGSLIDPNGYGDGMVEDSVVTVNLDTNMDGSEDVTLLQFINNIGISRNGYITCIIAVRRSTGNISEFAFCRLTPIVEALNWTILDGYTISDLFDIESNVPIDPDQMISPSVLQIIFDLDQSDITAVSAAFILSDKKNNWRRSNAKMISIFGENPSPAADALATYPVGTDYILNGGTI